MTLEAYLTRADWGAGPLRRGHVVPTEQFTALRVHHTVIVMPDYDRDGFLHGDIDDIKRYMRALQAARPDLGSEDPYSFVDFPGSKPGAFIIAEGRGPGVTGAHTENQNSWTYGVALPGNYEHETPTAGQVAGVRWCGARFLRDPMHAGRTLGHYQVPGQSTACPGANTKPLLGLMQPPFTLADLEVEEEEDMAEKTSVGYTKDGKRWEIKGIHRTEINKDTAEVLLYLGADNLGFLDADDKRWVLDATIVG